MQQRTLIVLHDAEPGKASWISLQPDGEILQIVSRGHLTEFPPEAKSYTTTVIVNAQDVLLTSATLPRLNHQRLMQALPFALEEQLIDDVTQLHFAIADYQADGTLPVAVVAKTKMEHWLGILQTYEIVPDFLIPSVFGLPFDETSWHVSLDHESCAVRKGIYQGFASEKNNLTALLQLTLAETEIKPESIHLYNILQETFEPLDIQIPSMTLHKTHLSEEAYLEKMASWAQAFPFINLLQGHYRLKSPPSETKKIWKIATYLTGSLVGLILFSNVISFFILNYKNNHLTTAINTIYKKNFPEATIIKAPQIRMEEKLQRLTEHVDKNDFLALLGQIGNTMTGPSIVLNHLDFHDNQLTLELTAASFNKLDELTAALTQEGLAVKQQNATESGDGVIANLSIQRGTP